MVKSILPLNTLPNGAHIVLSESEAHLVTHTLRELGEHKVKRALVLYQQERNALPAQVSAKKARPILHHICPVLETRGVNPVAVQLINVTAAQYLDWFSKFVNRVFTPVPTPKEEGS